MRTLIYGFGPYGKWKTNVTQRVLGKIPAEKDLRKKVFEVDFDSGQFLDEIKAFKPDFIIGLGQHPRGKKLRIERKAKNLCRGSKKQAPEPIRTNGPEYLFSSLRIKPCKECRVSYDAGQYVCNFSMYIVLESLKGSPVKFAFIHIPKDYDASAAARFVERVICSLK
jgi:pyrrolidone-carboxylate peptidase